MSERDVGQLHSADDLIAAVEQYGFLPFFRNEIHGSLKAIFAYFTELVRESEKMGTAYVDTAVELTEDQKQAVKNKLLATTSYQTFDVYYHVDPTLIGGMVIRVGDRVVDSSIRTKLEDRKSVV